MPTVFACLCGHREQVRDEFVGQTLRCPKCNAIVTPSDDLETQAARVIHEAPTSLEEALPVLDGEGEGPQVEFVCHACHDRYEVSRKLAGKAIKCRNCYELGRVLAPPPKPAPPPPPPTRKPEPEPESSESEPWFYFFVEAASAIIIVVSGIACLLGAVAVVRGISDGVVGALVVFGFVLAFIFIVHGIGLGLIIVDIGRNTREQASVSRAELELRHAQHRRKGKP